jgi:UDP-glucuronate 4-epimerase
MLQGRYIPREARGGSAAKALVTGGAGFIGSHLCERLLDNGHEVIAIDAMRKYYDPKLKARNLVALRPRAGFRFQETDLAQVDLAPLVDGCDFVFHLAAQPGVRSSWGADFHNYVEDNVWATQRLLEAVRLFPIKKLVYASSSSIYGDAQRYPTRESQLPQPISPYGVTKLAGEALCLAYGHTFDVPVVALRYFTVYGPRQRPEMAFSRFIDAILGGRAVTVFGDGNQSRDFTYVSDIVEATVQAAYRPVTGEVVNVAGGTRTTIREVCQTLHGITGREVSLSFRANEPGDVRHTGADTSKAREILGYRPTVSLEQGLRSQVTWLEECRYSS